MPLIEFLKKELAAGLFRQHLQAFEIIVFAQRRLEIVHNKFGAAAFQRARDLFCQSRVDSILEISEPVNRIRPVSHQKFYRVIRTSVAVPSIEYLGKDNVAPALGFDAVPDSFKALGLKQPINKRLGGKDTACPQRILGCRLFEIGDGHDFALPLVHIATGHKNDRRIRKGFPDLFDDVGHHTVRGERNIEQHTQFGSFDLPAKQIGRIDGHLANFRQVPAKAPGTAADYGRTLDIDLDVQSRDVQLGGVVDHDGRWARRWRDLIPLLDIHRVFRLLLRRNFDRCRLKHRLLAQRLGDKLDRAEDQDSDDMQREADHEDGRQRAA